jgi:hypothetical protein
MSAPHAPHAPHGRSMRGRRLRFAGLTLVLVLAATASLVIAIVLTGRHSARFDVTAMREHALSPRTEALLSGLSGGYEVVIAGPLKDPRTVDSRGLQRVADVLDQFKRAGREGLSVTYTLIDTGSTSGVEAYSALLGRLAERDKEKIRVQTESVTLAIGGARELADGLEALAPRLLEVRKAIGDASPNAATNQAYFDQRAHEAGLSARALRDLAAKAEQALASRAATGFAIPDLEGAAGLLRGPLGDMETGLRTMAADLATFGSAEGVTPVAAEGARGLAPEAARLRDRAALMRDALERMERIDLVRIANVLRSSSAVVVVGPPERGLTAIDFAELFPPPGTARGAVSADLGRSAEELLSTAIAALAQPVKPIVVLVHGQTPGFFDKVSFFQLMMQRLAMRGIDIVMWETADETDPPSLARLDPRGERPVVYVVFNTASFASGGAGLNGAQRASRLGRAVAGLVQRGEAVLMSVFPSTFPAGGEPDPTTAWLEPMGIRVEAGRPLLRERSTPEGRRVDAWQVLRALPGEHAILGATKGLPTRLEWPVAIRTDTALESGATKNGVTVTPLYRVEDSRAWGESQWLGYMQVPISQHASVPTPPSNDSSRDEAKGPWDVAVAVERRAQGFDRPQRLLIVGSNTWFSDAVMAEGAEVDGRIVAANPGNAELLEAGIYWLAGQDSAIAQSATARAVPLIRPLDRGTLSLLRWLAIAGLPGAVLVLGAAWRVLRG